MTPGSCNPSCEVAIQGLWAPRVQFCCSTGLMVSRGCVYLLISPMRPRAPGGQGVSCPHLCPGPQRQPLRCRSACRAEAQCNWHLSKPSVHWLHPLTSLPTLLLPRAAHLVCWRASSRGGQRDQGCPLVSISAALGGRPGARLRLGTRCSFRQTNPELYEFLGGDLVPTRKAR